MLIDIKAKFKRNELTEQLEEEINYVLNRELSWGCEVQSVSRFSKSQYDDWWLSLSPAKKREIFNCDICHK